MWCEAVFVVQLTLTVGEVIDQQADDGFDLADSGVRAVWRVDGQHQNGRRT